MLSPQKADLLHSLLGSLPPPMAAKLAQAVEFDRLNGGAGLPHDTILEALRPALRQAGDAERTSTPLRLFFRPFEDLLVLASPKTKQKGRIARMSVSAVWNWLAHTLIPDAAELYVSEIKALVQANRLDNALARAGEFWPLASNAMQMAFAEDPKAARLELQTQTVLEDAEEMALLLSVGQQIADIQRLLAKPAPQLSEDLLQKLRKVHDQVAAVAPDAAPYVAVVAMHRLAQPWEALKLAQAISRQTQDTLISSTDMGLVGDLLFADIEAHGDAVRTARHPMFDAEALLEHLARFAELSSGIVKEMDIRRDGKWGKRLLKDRASVAETMEGLMGRAPKEVLAMLPMQKTGSFGGGPKAADFSKPIDSEKAERGLRYARLVVGCATLAASASFGAAQKTALEEMSQHLRSYNEDLVREMRTATGERHVIVERQSERAVELTALIFSAEEAEFLRRRGRAAMADAA